MRLLLAWAALVRSRTRTTLAVAGVAVAAALLLDMVMLAGGMRDSFRDLLLVRGYQLRLSPKGTLPFDSEATVDSASAVVAALRADPRVTAVSPVLGGQLAVLDPRRAGGPPVTAIALGVLPSVQGDYERRAGRDPTRPDQFVANEAFLRAVGARVGDTVEVAAGYDPQLRQYAARRRLALVGSARFFYTVADRPVVALPLATLQTMRGAEGADRVSAFMARVADDADVEAVRADVERRIPRVSAISTATALAQVEQRLSYFRQLAFILGAISLGVGFLLVSTLVTVSVNERVGEIAVLRAVGVSRAHVVEQVVLEGLALTVVGTLLGLALGLVTARYLNTILSDFPGLPASFSFFVFRARDAWSALGLLVLSGVLAGVFPSWRAASLPVATTLREEAVG
ncbi:ABC transporter permease [Gemmatimonadetes bacterium T265]|nr:ABC transporter permease [Gemmatimonadetes bacterium T265]